MQQQTAINPTQSAATPPAYPLYPTDQYSYSYPTPLSNPNPTPYLADATSSQTYDASYYAQTAATATAMYSQPAAADATSAAGYYQDPAIQHWLSLYSSGLATNATQQLVAAKVKPKPWKNAGQNNFLKKHKIPVQHVWCDVCKIECTSKEILDSHKQGKKHKKNLEKLRASLGPAPVASVGVVNNPTIGPQENPKKRKNAKITEDLETKKKKIVAGGTAVGAVKTCEICNVVCNSELVFRYHLAGQKHVAMMKKGPSSLT